MAIIKLPCQDYLRQILSYDSTSGILTWRTRPPEHFPSPKASRIWNKRFPGKTAGYTDPKGYVTLRINRRLLKAHRVIFKMMANEEPIEVDHKNGKPNDNSWENLRACTRGLNMTNRRVKGNSTSGLKGVETNPTKTPSYSAYIGDNGKKRFIGRFRTAEEAHEAYCSEARRLYGEFYNPG